MPTEIEILRMSGVISDPIHIGEIRDFRSLSGSERVHFVLDALVSIKDGPVGVTMLRVDARKDPEICGYSTMKGYTHDIFMSPPQYEDYIINGTLPKGWLKN